MKNFFFVERAVLLKVCSEKTLRIMKLTNLLLFVAIINVFGSKAYCQNTKMNLDMKDVTLQSVLRVIEEQSEFFFLYSSKMIDVNQKVDIQADGKNKSEVMDYLLAKTDNRYSVKDRHVLLVNKEASTDQFSQQNVTGKITDSKTGEGLPGVNVIVKGTSIGTISDAEGMYSISVTDRNAILVFSFIGYTDKEIPSDGRTSVDIALEEMITGLDEVVVIGYGTQKKVTLTGAATSVKAVDLITMPNASLVQTLEGRAAGIRIQQGTSITGASANIRFRGSTQDPLYVIDDIVVEESGFDDITAEEIESINFMKDAATASIYGARAANGVVLVKTKRGGLNQKANFQLSGICS